jgi:hypothetical protein
MGALESFEVLADELADELAGGAVGAERNLLLDVGLQRVGQRDVQRRRRIGLAGHEPRVGFLAGFVNACEGKAPSRSLAK